MKSVISVMTTQVLYLVFQNSALLLAHKAVCNIITKPLCVNPSNFYNFFAMAVLLLVAEYRMSNYFTKKDQFILNFKFSIFSYIRIHFIFFIRAIFQACNQSSVFLHEGIHLT